MFFTGVPFYLILILIYSSQIKTSGIKLISVLSEWSEKIIKLKSNMIVRKHRLWILKCSRCKDKHLCCYYCGLSIFIINNKISDFKTFKKNDEHIINLKIRLK